MPSSKELLERALKQEEATGRRPGDEETKRTAILKARAIRLYLRAKLS